jgi:hypothetical protein
MVFDGSLRNWQRCVMGESKIQSRCLTTNPTWFFIWLFCELPQTKTAAMLHNMEFCMFIAILVEKFFFFVSLFSSLKNSFKKVSVFTFKIDSIVLEIFLSTSFVILSAKIEFETRQKWFDGIPSIVVQRTAQMNIECQHSVWGATKLLLLLQALAMCSINIHSEFYGGQLISDVQI